ncbi:hypothetical protein C8Q80DRAFT_1178153 [Daedaleopsis nitida]|nr:hypothetical protein C8Q80DRAFT_1178153 [Daedaleopsis nitida]
MAGYFAFPPPATSSVPVVPAVFAQQSQDADARAQQRPSVGSNRTWEDKQKREVAARERKLQLEREEALQGEMEWVGAGGWLRDAYGRKDKVRTERLRAEIRVRDEQRKILAQWATYEDHWRTLLASTGPISFQDIPWPVSPSPSSVDDLTPDAVAEFLLAPLRVKTKSLSRKDLLRTSLLRWHPDKLSAVMARTVEEDADSVRSGVNAVFRVLRSMQDSDRQHDSHSV